jgi:hypothetical protein
MSTILLELRDVSMDPLSKTSKIQALMSSPMADHRAWKTYVGIPSSPGALPFGRFLTAPQSSYMSHS